MKGFHAAEFLKRMEEPRLDGADGATERGGDAFEGIIHIKAKKDDLLMLGRQFGDQFLDGPG